MAAPRINIKTREIVKHAHRRAKQMSEQAKALRPVYMVVLVDLATNKPVALLENVNCFPKWEQENGEKYPQGVEHLSLELVVE